jgi:hypothetical protein
VRKILMLATGLLSVFALMAGLFVIGRLAEPAMTSCGGVMPERLRGTYAVITAEHRLFPPWKYTCVFTLNGRVVTRAPAPYP